MKNLNLIFRTSASFFFIFVVLLFGFDWVFSNFILFEKEYSNQNKVQRLLTQEHPLEIPVFGSSKARSAFIPDSLGPTVFNYGMEMSNFDVMELLLEVELNKKKNTPIVIEFNHRTFVHKPEHTINIATFIPNLGDQRVRSFMQRYNRLEWKHELPGFRYFGSYFYYLRYYMKEHAGNRKIISKGGNFTDLIPKKDVFQNFVNSRVQKVNKMHELTRRVNDIRLTVSDEERHILKYLNEYLLYEEHTDRLALFDSLVSAHPERQFLVVYTPLHWSERLGIENFHEIEMLFSRWKKEHHNLTVYNYSDLDLPDVCFKNTTHLNLKGARAFSSVFARDAAHHFVPEN